jgi:hypothetical protein
MSQGPGATLTGIRVRVYSEDDPTPRLDRTVRLGDGGDALTLPADLLGISPRNGDPMRVVRVESDALHGGTVMFTHRSRVRFVAGRTLLLEVFFAEQCRTLAAMCPAGLTCGRTGCEPETLLSLPEYAPSTPADASTELDVAPGPDARSDASAPGDAPPDRAVLYVVGDPASPSQGDTAVQARLRGLGFTVRVMDDAAASAANVVGMRLVVISESVDADIVVGRFRDVGVPVLVLEDNVYHEMGMTNSFTVGGHGRTTAANSVTITDPAHPLAAGRTGSLVVYNSAPGTLDLGWGSPSAAAVRVAATGDVATHYAVFAYERGAMMYGFVAPARRTGFFVDTDRTGAAQLTPDGLALLDAAINWTSGF